MLLSRNSGCKDTLFLLNGKRFRVIFLSGIFSRISQQNGPQRKNPHCERVVKVADDVQRRDVCQSGGNQHLRSVGDDALYQTRERIEYAGRFSSVEMEPAGNVFRYRAGCDNGDGVVCSAQIGDTDQRGNAQLGSPLPVYTSCQPFDDKVYPPVVADGFEHSSRQQGDDDELAHPGDAFSHRAEPSEEVETAGGYADDAAHDGSHEKYDHHVYPCDCRAQNGDIRNHFDPFYRLRMRRSGDRQPLKDVYRQYDKSRRDYNHGVYAKLVAHHALLRFRRSNRSVGYERQVVAEKRAADDNRYHKRKIDAGLFRQSCGNGRQGDYCSHAGSDRQGDEACGDKYARQQQIVREKVQCQIHCGVDSSICLALCAKAPARMKIQIISMIFLFEAPTEN